MINRIIILPLIFFIRFYQLFISPIIGQNCRYLPTCSEYTVGCLKNFGLIKGIFLSLKRISKCHPWGSHGHDPIPNNLEKKL
tara:strand:- start:292 stop:537 length:246 start_codon:yes stop_codon:yes gene_type:complete